MALSDFNEPDRLYPNYLLAKVSAIVVCWLSSSPQRRAVFVTD
jgi:hypothetical protein